MTLKGKVSKRCILVSLAVSVSFLMSSQVYPKKVESLILSSKPPFWVIPGYLAIVPQGGSLRNQKFLLVTERP